MIDEVDKYRVEIFKIAGFSMMIPLGRLFVEPMVVYKEFGLVPLILFIIVSLGLAFAGLVLLVKGYDIIYTQRRIK